MTLNLPEPVAAYFKADEADSDAVARCFLDNAIVKDEGHTYHGQAAIKKWKEDVSAKYIYTCEPLKCEQQDGKVVVTCRLNGNFPGSPADLRFFFKLAGEQIASLEIIP
ncbi:nuclear transport factor 2 family protein [Blastopirellula sp. J2-11]|uniref:nuclear transport factor 2 family protein n=1 Tax=Blastopirellula sp. J2-11 TaxID=2943192 RepID=UPI0021C96536|nr:nuclear transport factor 2 family protein [Blastopirellula sp. J2-11]UUO08699.1 nuclear transport factor 2 family protein [Blastopirellula sp. J2-11]